MYAIQLKYRKNGIFTIVYCVHVVYCISLVNGHCATGDVKYCHILSQHLARVEGGGGGDRPATALLPAVL